MNPPRSHNLPERKLIYFPIVHSQADLGDMAESVKRSSIQKIGRMGWKRKQDLIDKYWTDIETKLGQLNLSFDKVRVFQDALPVSDKEVEIVAKLAEKGSRNHALILSLIKKGANLMGTESGELLLEEYELEKKRLQPVQPSKAQATDKAMSRDLIKKRDEFIARRINDVLQAGETAILFIGALHSVEPFLDEDIEVTYPLGRPAVKTT
jgi:hypothetical protein